MCGGTEKLLGSSVSDFSNAVAFVSKPVAQWCRTGIPGDLISDNDNTVAASMAEASQFVRQSLGKNALTFKELIHGATTAVWLLGTLILVSGTFFSPTVAFLGSSLLAGGSALLMIGGKYSVSLHWQIIAVSVSWLVVCFLMDPPLDRRKKHR